MEEKGLCTQLQNFEIKIVQMLTLYLFTIIKSTNNKYTTFSFYVHSFDFNLVIEELKLGTTSHVTNSNKR